MKSRQRKPTLRPGKRGRLDTSDTHVHISPGRLCCRECDPQYAKEISFFDSADLDPAREQTQPHPTCPVRRQTARNTLLGNRPCLDPQDILPETWRYAGKRLNRSTYQENKLKKVVLGEIYDTKRMETGHHQVECIAPLSRLGGEQAANT